MFESAQAIRVMPLVRTRSAANEPVLASVHTFDVEFLAAFNPVPLAQFCGQDTWEIVEPLRRRRIRRRESAQGGAHDLLDDRGEPVRRAVAAFALD